jgi:hypothetical protein
VFESLVGTVMATFSCHSTDTSNHPLTFEIQIGYETDIGGGRENQDESFVWKSSRHDLTIVGVLDGHGREVGKIAAQAGKQGLIDYFNLHDHEFLSYRPENFLIDSFSIAHQAIKAAFHKELTYQGYIVTEDSAGYLLKRRSSTLTWSCVHGGTSCSLILLHNHHLYSANVGDSSALLCVDPPALLQPTVEYVVDGSIDKETSIPSQTCQPAALSNFAILTVEHSPESEYEFRRLRQFRRREDNPALPALLIAYDAPNCEKSNCPPVFMVGENDEVQVTSKGK